MSSERASARPETGTGTAESPVPPLPRRPLAPAPQHRTVPPANTAHECAAPMSSERASARPETGTGTAESPVPPFPRRPLPPAPQHHTVPSSRSAHVCAAPAATVTAWVRSETRPGSLRDAVAPLPRRPLAPAPQQSTPLPSPKAVHVWASPAATPSAPASGTSRVSAPAVNVKSVPVNPSGLPGAHSPATSWQGDHQARSALSRIASVSSVTGTAPSVKRSHAVASPAASRPRTAGRNDPSTPYVHVATAVTSTASATSSTRSTVPSPSMSQSTRSTTVPIETSAVKPNSSKAPPSGERSTHTRNSVAHGAHQRIVATPGDTSRSTGTPPTSRGSQPLRPPAPVTVRTCGRYVPAASKRCVAAAPATDPGRFATGAVSSTSPLPSKSHSNAATPLAASASAMNVNVSATLPSGPPTPQPLPDASKHGVHQRIVAVPSTTSRSTGSPASSRPSQVPNSSSPVSKRPSSPGCTTRTRGRYTSSRGYVKVAVTVADVGLPGTSTRVRITCSRRNTSVLPFVSPATRFEASEANATCSPWTPIAGAQVPAPSACVPSAATLTRSVVLEPALCRKTSVLPFVSPATRFEASDANAT